MAGGSMYARGHVAEGHAWNRMCVAGEVDSMHPTGMLSCFICDYVT